MPKLTKRLTDSVAISMKLTPPPATEPDAGGKMPPNQEIYWCKDTPGFGVRVTRRNTRSWIFERRVNGETVRRTIGKVTGRAAISADAARTMCVELSADLQRGDDPLRIKQEQAKQARSDITFGEAVQQYVDGKVRAKDGKPLKKSTKAGYLNLIAPSRLSRRYGDQGRTLSAGYLYGLSRRPLRKITGDEIRALHAHIQKKAKRMATLAMQLVRAVFNWHGVIVSDNPFSKLTPGRDRIILPASTGNPNPIPPERLGAFWRAACVAGRDRNRGSAESADAIRLVLLTGGRNGETAGTDYVQGILVRDYDPAGARITLNDTKNRQDHVIYLSTQAQEIAQRLARGKKPDDNLIPVRDVGKTLDVICAVAGIAHRSIHEVRKTFASVADELVSGYTLKRMLNHALANDVTGVHYVNKSEGQLRRGWQMVADFIEEEAAAAPEVDFPKKGVRVSKKNPPAPHRAPGRPSQELRAKRRREAAAIPRG